tara:strand:- start:1957 stop:2892 length:936 start_codon:yes stop_codon:yes gene_type:complete
MPGGYIFQKFEDDGTTPLDKSLIIDPNYAYQVPFDFADWNDIKIGMFVSYVITGAGVDSNNNAVNGNVGYDIGNTNTKIISAGGISVDGFNYIGIMKSGAAGDDPTLPLTAGNSGFLGCQADRVNLYKNSSTAYNKLYHSDTSVNTTDTQGNSRFLASNETTVLEEKILEDSKGNFNVIVLEGSDAYAESAGGGSPEYATLFHDYWGMRFKVLNKGTSTQKIRVDITHNGSNANDNTSFSSQALSDPSMVALKKFINGVGEKNNTNMHTSTDGFEWNDGSNGYALPDSLFFYNAFQEIRPRIHAWAIKKIS